MTRAWAAKTSPAVRARPDLGLAGQQGLPRGGVEREMPGAGLADHHGAHQRGVVVAPDAGEFERDLVPASSRRRPDL